MKINKKRLINAIPNNPFNFEFQGQYIIVYSHEMILVYTYDGTLLSQLEDAHGGNMKLLPGDLFWGFYFEPKIYDKNGKLSKLKFKAPKKSIEMGACSYPPAVLEEAKEIIVGFRKGGTIGIYDFQLKPKRFIDLEKDECLIFLDYGNRRAFTHKAKKGLVYLYSYPEFEKINEFKIAKQNDGFVLNASYIFNFGYTPTNYLIELATGESKQIRFHPTHKKGYKEQYKGPHNFGTSLVTWDKEEDKLLMRSHQNKCIVFDMVTQETLVLNIHELFGINPFEYTTATLSCLTITKN